jgi:Uma2 family endonuclease
LPTAAVVLRRNANHAIEIGSPSTRRRDETIKRRLYERFDVSEYWVIDPELDEIKVFRHREDRYERVAELTLEHNDVLTSPLLPGLELPLNRIFGDSPLPG